MTITDCLYGSDLCGRTSYQRGGCRGAGCIAANSAYLAEWRRRPVAERSRNRNAVKPEPKRARKPAPMSYFDMKPEPPMNTIPLGVFVRSELGRAVAEGFSPEYVAWLEHTTEGLGA